MTTPANVRPPQTWLTACKSTGSSGEPPFSVKNSLLPPAYSCHRREPHPGQKPQSSTRPLSVGRDQKRGVPETSLKSARLTQTEMPNAEADCLRHSRQWQRQVLTGGAETWK